MQTSVSVNDNDEAAGEVHIRDMKGPKNLEKQSMANVDLFVSRVVKLKHLNRFSKSVAINFPTLFIPECVCYANLTSNSSFQQFLFMRLFILNLRLKVLNEKEILP